MRGLRVRIVAESRAENLAVAEDHLETGQRLGARFEVADAPLERVADEAGLARRAGHVQHQRQLVLLQVPVHLSLRHTGFDDGIMVCDIDLADGLHAAEVDDDRAVLHRQARAEAPVPAAADWMKRDLELIGDGDELLDFRGRRRQEDGGDMSFNAADVVGVGRERWFVGQDVIIAKRCSPLADGVRETCRIHGSDVSQTPTGVSSQSSCENARRGG